MFLSEKSGAPSPTTRKLHDLFERSKVSAGMRCWLVGRDRNFVLSEGDNIIGRDPSCSVYVDDPDVSRRHALIRIDSVCTSALLEDLDSTNGTLLGRSS